MEQLSSLDAVFLAVEDRRNPMNIGTVAIFEGPVPSFDEVRDFLAARIALAPRCRQRIRMPVGLVGRPMWVDDVHFDLDAHVRALSLSGRDEGDLDRVVADLLAAPLDRSRPLWEVWFVDGLSRDRWAIVAKVHHCMLDGIAGSDLLGVVLTGRPDEHAVAPDRWAPEPEPSGRAVAWFGLRTALGSLAAHGRGASGTLRHPVRARGRARDVLAAAGRLWYRRPHVATSLVGPIGTYRRWARVAVPLAEVDAIRAALGGTVNDVVVAAVACGFRDLLVGRGESVEGRTVTAMVPVSLRAPDRRGMPGNRVANVHALLPVGQEDPRSMLEAIHAHLEDLKGSHEVEATGLLMRIGDYVPRVLADRIARTVVRRQRNVETVITDVPGPRSPRYLAGRRMVAGYPVAPIAGQVRISVAIWSYCDRLHVGLTGDRDTVPDIERLGRGITRGFERLVDAARADQAGP